MENQIKELDEKMEVLTTRMDAASKAFSTAAALKLESDDLGDLFTALAKAQLEMKPAKEDSTNPYFKSNYADLSSMVKASREALAKNGLSVIQRIIPNGDRMAYIHTRLCHSSGQWMESRMVINPPKQDIQTVGSYITYLRRYTYACIVGVVAAGEDDDAEQAMENPRVRGEDVKKAPTTISKPQLEILASELEGNEEIVDSLLKGFKITKISDLPAKNYTQCINRIREIRRAKEA